MSSLFLLSSDFYTGSGHIKVHAWTLDGLIFAKIPLDFVRKGGLDTWEFVLDLVNMLVDPVPDARVMLKQADGESVDLSSSPSEGHYVYVQEGSTAPMRFSRGPMVSGGSKKRKSVDDSSTITAPSSSAYQSRFRRLLERRDFNCLIKSTRANYCDAAHIVPKSLPEVYRDIYEYGVTSLAPIYRTSSGLLLNLISHRSFDQMEWSIYPNGDLYHVHFFVRTEYSELHGMIIPKSRFRIDSEDELPDPRLLRWHYAQCALGHIRGFAAQLPTVAEQAETMRREAQALLPGDLGNSSA